MDQVPERGSALSVLTWRRRCLADSSEDLPLFSLVNRIAISSVSASSIIRFPRQCASDRPSSWGLFDVVKAKLEIFFIVHFLKPSWIIIE
ncbi:predicted protein [Plenodomus lingam JN3]|uniref:Predicted protein n=1 Tax=Leptosphaeria maculans (strain JN3 / isolate v23.1.3 / race Av1-4-5-6-7-8) TaxID=985895 RepID=E4ZX23_LEPMJ|nr:predicted protein [Plenodomus lingam JN3]CBX95233.1 predicted protein [Plenodomus lingam JN3]